VPTPSYPNFAGKHAGQALFTAADFLAYLRQAGALDDRAAPDGAVLCYQRSLYDHVLRAEGLKPPRRLDLPLPLPSTGGKVGLLGQFGIGAPAATAVLEQLGRRPAGAPSGRGSGGGAVARTRSVRDKCFWLALLANGGNSSAGRALITSRGFCSRLELSLNPAAH
jgi:hypothetical protein